MGGGGRGETAVVVRVVVTLCMWGSNICSVPFSTFLILADLFIQMTPSTQWITLSYSSAADGK